MLSTFKTCHSSMAQAALQCVLCGSHLLSQLQVAGLYSLSFLTEGDTLEEGDGLLLPEDAVVLLLQVDKRVAGLAVPDVGQPSLHSQPKVVADHLHI